MKGPGGGFYLDSGDMSTPLSEVVKASTARAFLSDAALGLNSVLDSTLAPCIMSSKAYATTFLKCSKKQQSASSIII
ncbi:MAG: hypothetical protein LBJ04_20175 [Sphingobacterium sp.]|nr:hypothetical protein [Sphingobacterium sp.]